jgi:hypothetical protein
MAISATGCASAEEVSHVEDKLFLWALGQASSRSVALQVVQCLQEDFLLKLPVLGHNHY